MTLIELFNQFNDACRKVTLTSDARSLFLAFMQHWNEQRRPQALDISLASLRKTACLDEESYRRAAICLSNLKFWQMKRKAHDKQGRLIRIGEFFLAHSGNCRETAAEPVFSASPPTPPSEPEENPPQAAFSSPETKTNTSESREAQEISAPEGAKIPVNRDWFRDKTFNDVYNSKAAMEFLNHVHPRDYEEIFNELRRNEARAKPKLAKLLGA